MLCVALLVASHTAQAQPKPQVPAAPTAQPKSRLAARPQQQAVAPIAEADIDRPVRAVTIHLAPLMGWLDLFSGSVVVHVIPYLDLEVGVGANPGTAVYGRGGPRIQVAEFRDAKNTGWTFHGSALLGFKSYFNPGEVLHGANLVGAFEATIWLARHFGINFQLLGGLTFSPRGAYSAIPDLRVSFGPAF